MATIKVLVNDTSALGGVVKQLNALHDATVAVTTDGYHNDISSVGAFSDPYNPTSSNLQVALSAGSTLDGYVALALQEQAVLAQHFGDAYAHLIADVVNVAFDGYSINYANNTVKLSSAIAMANAMKLNYNAHLSQSGVHRKTDTANSVSASDATDQASLVTLLNAIKTAVNAHIVSGPSIGKVQLVY